jgi:peptidyl-prolyl cis-trans isomerase B (cyclophilin B)
MMRMRGVLLAMMLFCVLVIVSCGQGTTDSDSSLGSGADESKRNPIVTIEMDSGKTILIELYPDIAPNTVANFISLIQSNFYDGTIFHRVIPGFMVQGGDPEGTGMGGPGYSIEGEFASNGFENGLLHERGVLSMARTQDPNSAGSQFFIMVDKAPSLDGAYAAFGRVIEWMEVVDGIVNVETGAQDRPLENQTIKKITVDTYGIEYGEPQKSMGSSRR